MNKILLISLMIICLISCKQEERKKENEEPLDPELYMHPDSIKDRMDNSLNIESSSLPIHGIKEFIEGIDDDTIYHTIPNWEFINQNGDVVSSEDYLGKIYVADFFFTSCPTICPIMTVNMMSLQERTKDLGVQFLSYTVDPKRDNSETLKQYQDAYGINGNNWNLITGDQYKIYELGVKGFLVPNQEDALAPGGFLHSEKMMLIDQLGRIRGYYDGTDESQMNDIVNDIKKLRIEQDTINRN